MHLSNFCLHNTYIYICRHIYQIYTYIWIHIYMSYTCGEVANTHIYIYLEALYIYMYIERERKYIFRQYIYIYKQTYSRHICRHIHVYIAQKHTYTCIYKITYVRIYENIHAHRIAVKKLLLRKQKNIHEDQLN